MLWQHCRQEHLTLGKSVFSLVLWPSLSLNCNQAQHLYVILLFKASILYLIECTLSVFRGTSMQTFSDGGFNLLIAPLPSPVSALTLIPVPVFDPPVLMNTWPSFHRHFQGYSISLVTKFSSLQPWHHLILDVNFWAAASEHVAWGLNSDMVWLLACCPPAWRLMLRGIQVLSSSPEDCSVCFP